ncbi:hypothetical protein AA309_29005 [Microvirga vignae]|uniref:Uncharacterized protein n=1 Tax=Microvirga vignae TaxID=1225564 RepID=A0A0H1RBA8_9HYPH|nr:cold shock domain-containing protein [Microvirga vignae]KLK89857.1 hypothetical protein AA309_29005 [Microvirga vignae]
MHSETLKGFPDDDGRQEVFVNAVAVERAGLRNLVEGQRVSFDTFIDLRSGTIAVHDVEAA